MKKKFKVIVSALLIAVSVFAFTACGTFGGEFKEEATDEQITKIANAAGSSVSDKIEEDDVYGWVYDVKMSNEVKGGDEPSKQEIRSSLAVDVAGEYALKLKVKVDGNTFNIENYRKDGAQYLKVGNASIKIPALFSNASVEAYADEFVALGGSMFIEELADLCAELTVEGKDALEAAGIKLYVDESGDNFKVKYDFSEEALKSVEGEETDVKIKSGFKANVIVVFDKELTRLEGVKTEFKYEYSATENGKEVTVKQNLVVSAEASTKAVKFPNLDKYGEANGTNVGAIIDECVKFMKSFGNL